MRTILLLSALLVGVGTMSAQQATTQFPQQSTQTATKKAPSKNAIISSGSKQVGHGKASAEKPETANNANGGLPPSYDPSDASRYPNTSGSAVSPSSPNYPYAPDGTLIVSPTNVKKGTKATSTAPKPAPTSPK